MSTHTRKPLALDRDRPIADEATFVSLCRKVGLKPEQDQAYKIIKDLYEDIRNDNDKRGLAISISGSWGIGKSSYVNILADKLSSDYLVVHARGMFYGNFDEYIESFFGTFYRSVKKRHNLTLSELKVLARNTTISLEAGINLGPFSVKANRSQKINFKKETSSDEILASGSPINNKLGSIGPQKIIVVLEDIDRLKGNELVTALRLIETLKWLNNVVVIAVGDLRHMGDILSTASVPSAYSFTRKVFDHRVHLKRTLRQTEKIVLLMAEHMVGDELNDTQKVIATEAYHFLVLRQIISNVIELAREVIDTKDIEKTTGHFWDLLVFRGHPSLGQVYGEIKGFFNTQEKDGGVQHKIWSIKDGKVVGQDNQSDGMSLLVNRPGSHIKPWTVQRIYRGIQDYKYWSELIVPSPDEDAKLDRYNFSDDISNIANAFREIDNDEKVDVSFLGKEQPVSRWSIVRAFMRDPGQNAMDRDYSLAQLNDLRLLKGFSAALVERMEELQAASITETEKLRLFVECVDVFEALIRIEKGDI
ncbi:MAG: P-loop NTPase fold protein [Patescibacteria group bacterium]